MRQQQQQQPQTDNSGREIPMAAAPAAALVIGAEANNNGNETQSAGRHVKRRSVASNQAVYEELIGAIDQGTSSTRFLVFEKGTGELVASSQLEIKRITPREGWVEIDPNSIMSSVYATMANVHDQLQAKQHQFKKSIDYTNTKAADQLVDTSFLIGGDQHQHQLQRQLQHQHRPQPAESGRMFLKCIGICNQRESAVVWDSKTGRPLYNVIVWMDNRTKDIVDDMIDSIPGRDFNHLKDKTGLPMSTYFSAFKLRWLIDNVPEVRKALKEKRLLVGTVDSWILWNLTGKHLTDVTNASRTFLMDIETLQWDKSLCKQFKVPMEILPKILSSADDFGVLQFGPFIGTPVTGVIGDQSAALFGHNCLQLGQTKATFGTGCFIMQNIGPGPLSGAQRGMQRGAKRGLITTVAYKLKDKPVCYALEGSIKIAGAALTWLRDNMQLIQNYEECDQLVNTTTHSAGVFFVPALGGLYSPYWDPNAAGLFIGLSQFTRREHLVRATFDSIAFQTNDILSLMRGVTNGLMIDGGLCKSDNLCQILADIVGCDIVRPAMCETSALGAAMVAGCGAGIWDFERMLAHSNTPYVFSSSAHQTHHYPPESLHHPPALTQFKNSLSGSSDGSKQGPDSQHQEVQHQLQPTKHHRRSLRQRNGGRLTRNLDAGGGINDDAGGGGGGGPTCSSVGAPERLQQLAAAAAAAAPNHIHSQHQQHSSQYHNQRSSLSKEALSSSSDDRPLVDIAREAGTTGAFTAPLLPAVLENHTIESSYETTTHLTDTSSLQNDLSAESDGSSDRRRARAITSLLGGHRHGAPCCSGYSSCDNFELATTNSSSALTDSMRPLAGARTYSPVGSQETDLLTTSGRNSVATYTEDLTNITNHQHHLEQLEHGADFVAASIVSNGATTIDLYLESSQLSVQSGPSANSAAATMGTVQANNNRKFEANAEDVADEVQEFGGRDSYGEDGYDSSAVSFDSYDDDNDDDGQAGRQEAGADGFVDCDNDADNDVAYYGDDNSETHADQNGPAQSDSHDVITPTDDDSNAGHTKMGSDDVAATVANQHNHNHPHSLNNQAKEVIDANSVKNSANSNGSTNSNSRRDGRKQASLLEKQMDVFEPYISLEHRTELVETWRMAVNRSMQWTKVHHEEIRRIDYQRLSSLPISMYVFFSIGLVALSGFFSPTASIFSAART